MVYHLAFEAVSVNGRWTINGWSFDAGTLHGDLLFWRTCIQFPNMRMEHGMTCEYLSVILLGAMAALDLIGTKGSVLATFGKEPPFSARRLLPTWQRIRNCENA